MLDVFQELPPSVRQWLREPPVSLLASLWLAAVFVLAAPRQWIDGLGLAALVASYRSMMGFLVVLGGGALLWRAMSELWQRLHAMSKRRRLRRSLHARLSELSSEETGVLREYEIREKRALNLPVDQPTVAQMIKDGLLVPVAKLGTRTVVGCLFPLEIARDVRVYMQTHQLLPQFLTVADRRAAEEVRPWFCIAVERHEQRQADIGLYV